MHSYEPRTPRVALGITAFAMTAITMGVLVVMPATVEAVSDQPRTLAATKVTPPAFAGTGTAATIDTFAIHAFGSITAPCTASAKPAG